LLSNSLPPRGERLFAFAGERMCGESDDWNVAGLPHCS
jgi:hypothetical protein